MTQSHISTTIATHSHTWLLRVHIYKLSCNHREVGVGGQELGWEDVGDLDHAERLVFREVVAQVVDERIQFKLLLLRRQVQHVVRGN